MGPSKDEQELIRNILLKTFPEANAFDDDTLDKILHRQPVTFPSEDDDNALHMDLSTVISLLSDSVPVIAGVVTIVRGYYEIQKLKKESVSAQDLPQPEDIADEVIKKYPPTESRPDPSIVSKDPSIVSKIASNAINLFTTKS
jgi:hypothetical protein